MSDIPLEPMGYYKWHWKDYRADRRVSRMDWKARGIYRELLDECWSKGGIPDNAEDLADIVGCEVEDITSAWQMLSKCFKYQADGSTCLTLASTCLADSSKKILISEKMEEQRTAKDAQRVLRSLAGKRGGKNKHANASENKDLESKKGPESKQVLASANIEEKRREEKRIKDIAHFEKFWDLYDKKTDRQKALKAWNKLSAKERDLCLSKVPDYVKATPDPQYRKNPTTYLNGKNWNDELNFAVNGTDKNGVNMEQVYANLERYK